ncbi:DUF3472 domain-containing protein [Streptomyces sp. NBC_00121]|uniref:DUF3472 domain-containing protein n=1 Tax=unclassified Streptomyces TaxID=2593676 RepID=UPI002DDAF6CA|nr:DUF3472 domain-containing protein [Streptomyces sp. NBC_01760]WSC73082.1 DUF3472 domain-containing protein [Streptomyces sp. NBC_01760]WTE55464.1 DUF3472 domain-containing protein [Streptomyces sp. NBC_01620]
MRSRSIRRLTRAAGILSGALAALLYTTGPAAAAVTPGGLVSNSYSISGAPAEGLEKLAFPLKVISQPNDGGYYWAQQYYFKSGQVGYIGLQPRVDSGLAVFSVFGSGTSTTHPNCRTGADGGSGTSCSVTYPYVKGRWYQLEIIKTGTDNWTGYVVDTSTNTWTTIGSWNVSSSAGLLKPSGVGFVEYYKSVADCASIPYGQAVWGKPFVSPEPGTGTNTSAYTYGPCKADASYGLSGGEVTMTTGG